jgi:hypothetical protein
MTTANLITLTADEAAKAVGLARSTLAKLRLSGTGPSITSSGGGLFTAGKTSRRGSKPALLEIPQTLIPDCQRA